MSTNERSIVRLTNGAIYLLGLTLAGLILYYADSFYAIRVRHSNFVLGICLAIYYLGLFRDQIGDSADEKATSSGYRASIVTSYIVDWVPDRFHISPQSRGVIYSSYSKFRAVGFLTLAVLAIITMVYINQNLLRLRDLAPIQGYTQLDYLVGLIVVYLCADATTRAFGFLMGLMVPLAFLFGLAGPYLPGVFGHGGLTVNQLIRYSSISTGGVYGFILQIGATWVAIFLLLAGLAQSYKILDYLISVSREFGKVVKSGIVQVAVVSSMAFGSITGASSANTATTGSFTIPMMKEQGVDKSYAGAIETVASLGGQLVPPIMGIAAFIMADLLGIPYLSVVQGALIPAILFYSSVFISVHLLVYKNGWTTKTAPIEEVDFGKFKGLLWYAFPFGLLVYLLAVLQYSPMKTGYYTIISLFVVVLLKTVYEQGLSGVKRSVKMSIEGCRQGAVEMAPLIIVLGSIGVIISVLIQTGFAQQLSARMVGLSGGILILLLVIAMAISLIFGLGIPAPAAYILVASLVASSLTQFGINDLTAHLFVFYFAMYSSLTPPVGPATAIAANLAGAKYMGTAYKGILLAIPGFLIPYVFVTNNSIIYWEFPLTIIVTFVVLVGLSALCMAIFAYDGKRISLPIRSVYLTVSGLLLFGVYLGLFGRFIQTVLGVLLFLFILGRNTTFNKYLPASSP